MHARSLVYLSAWRRCFLSDLVKSCPSAAAFAVHSVMDDYDDMGDDENIFARPRSPCKHCWHGTRRSLMTEAANGPHDDEDDNDEAMRPCRHVVMKPLYCRKYSTHRAAGLDIHSPFGVRPSVDFEISRPTHCFCKWSSLT